LKLVVVIFLNTLWVPLPLSLSFEICFGVWFVYPLLYISEVDLEVRETTT